MSARSKARKRALDVLFEADQRGVDVLALLRERTAVADPPLPAYAVTLIEGVAADRARIDDLLTTYSHGWTIERMPAVDRAALRIGAWEILDNDDVPAPVAIAEAVQLVRTLSTDQSPGFVNGLLARIAEVLPVLAGTTPTPPAEPAPAGDPAE